MNLMPRGDYYVWDCEWCDSRNLTIWMKVESDNLVCTACQRRFSLKRESRSTHQNSHISLMQYAF